MQHWWWNNHSVRWSGWEGWSATFILVNRSSFYFIWGWLEWREWNVLLTILEQLGPNRTKPNYLDAFSRSNSIICSFVECHFMHLVQVFVAKLIQNSFDNSSGWLHSGYILTKFWLHFDYIFITFWLHSDYILTAFLLYVDCILTTARPQPEYFWFILNSFYYFWIFPTTFDYFWLFYWLTDDLTGLRLIWVNLH